MALNLFLNKDYQSLLTVDFVCHGVPSPIIFEEYIKYMEEIQHSSVENFTFREKDLGWRKQITKLYFANGVVDSHESHQFPLYKMFYDGIFLRNRAINVIWPKSKCQILRCLIIGMKTTKQFRNVWNPHQYYKWY